MTERFFLCCGIPKSGTTFLQRTLDLHPEISCPSEQNFEAILTNIDSFVVGYNRSLQVIDRRTGGQGAPSLDGLASAAILRDTIVNISRGFADGKPVHGLNDNSAFFKLKFYNELFDSPPVICIFRNPVDQALSAWRHNHRLAREEKEMAAAHLKMLDNPEGTLEGFVRKHLHLYNDVVDGFLDYADGRPNILVVRYESLVEDKAAELERLYAFLGVDISPDLLSAIAAQSAPEQMAAASAQPAFFGVNDPQKEAVGVDEAFRRQSLQACSRQLEGLGYRLAA